MPPWLDAGLLRGAALDLRGAQVLHRAAARPWALQGLLLCSRLADGPLWLVLILGMPWLSKNGVHEARALLALGAVNLALYYSLERGTRRPRPFDCCADIRACLAVPDAFSFPSGHALHAFAFATLLSGLHPAWGPLLWALAGLVGLARVVLGVHFPSDVLAGALIGIGTGSLMLLAL